MRKFIYLPFLMLTISLSIFSYDVPTYIPQNGLVAWYPFNGNANDESGNGNDGTPGSGVKLTTDRFFSSNAAYDFNGSGNISLTSLPTTGAQDFTISGWVKTNNTTVRKGIACWGQDDPWQGSTYFFVTKTGYLKFDFAYFGGPQSSTFIADNQWHHVAVTCISGLIQLYLNGQPTTTALQMNHNISGANKALGANIYESGSSENFVGSLDDIGIWNRALTSDEIKKIYFWNGISIKLDTLNSVSGKSLQLPVKVSSILASDSISTYQFEMTYDTTIVKYVDVDKSGTMSSTGELLVNSAHKGKLKIAYMSSTDLVGMGELLKLNFNALGAGTFIPQISNFILSLDTIKNIETSPVSVFTRYGDVNGDDNISAYDAGMLLKQTVGLDPMPAVDPIPWTPWRLEASDVDNSGLLTAFDAGLILQRSIDLIQTFPVEIGNSLAQKTPSEVDADVIITKELNNLIFRSTGNLVGLNVSIEGAGVALGIPKYELQNSITASNKNGSTYKIGLATAIQPAENSVLFSIPIIQSLSQDLTFKLIINKLEKEVKFNVKTDVISVKNEYAKIFPNPTSDNITISTFDNQIGGSTIRIVNQIGQTVYTSILNASSNTINLRNVLPTGVYQIQIIDNELNTIYSDKLILK